jgi:hypothetical protein
MVVWDNPIIFAFSHPLHSLTRSRKTQDSDLNAAAAVVRLHQRRPLPRPYPDNAGGGQKA